MAGAGRNFTQLAEANVLPCDARIRFDERKHEYKVDGKQVSTSVTAILKRISAEEPFDGDFIIRKNLASWRRNPNSKYGNAVSGKSDREAAAYIKKQWSDANRLGTKLHKRLEGLLNGEHSVADGETDVEWPALTIAIDDLMQLGAQPFRTELSLFWERADAVIAAGQVDVLMRHEKDDGTYEYIMVDLKRTDKAIHCDMAPFGGKMCNSPMDQHPSTDFTKYSLQISMYCVMLQQRTGITVPTGNRFILKVHPSLSTAELIPCACFDKEAIEILNSL